MLNFIAVAGLIKIRRASTRANVNTSFMPMRLPTYFYRRINFKRPPDEMIKARSARDVLLAPVVAPALPDAGRNSK